MSKFIIYCRCVHCNFFLPEEKKLFESALNSGDNDLYIVDDLCGLTADKNHDLLQYAYNENLSVIACHPRAVRWLLSTLGIPSETMDSIEYFNMNEDSWIHILESLSCDVTADLRLKVEKVVTKADEESGKDATQLMPVDERELAMVAGEKSGRPWFPVVDYDRCTQCGACIDFCLFGVYEKNEEDRIEVTNPGNCKDNCPACARVCPHNAIIFPKYDKAPVNGDLSGVNPEEKHKKPVFALSGDELYNSLSKRKTKSKGLYK